MRNLDGMRRGFTLVETLVVVFLTSLVLALGFLLWRQTGTTVQMSTSMLDQQQALRAITEALRSDIRTMARVRQCSGERLEFDCLKDDHLVSVSYHRSREDNSLVRQAAGHLDHVFQPRGIVTSIQFVADPRPGQDPSILMILGLEFSPETGKGSRMTVVNEFFPRSLEQTFERVP